MSKGQEEKKLEHAEVSTRLLWNALKNPTNSGFKFVSNVPMLPEYPTLHRKIMDISNTYRLSQIGGHKQVKKMKTKKRSYNETNSANDTSWRLEGFEKQHCKALFGIFGGINKHFTVKGSLKMWEKSILRSEYNRNQFGHGSSSQVLRILSAYTHGITKTVNADTSACINPPDETSANVIEIDQPTSTEVKINLDNHNDEALKSDESLDGEIISDDGVDYNCFYPSNQDEVGNSTQPNIENNRNIKQYFDDIFGDREQFKKGILREKIFDIIFDSDDDSQNNNDDLTEVHCESEVFDICDRTHGTINVVNSTKGSTHDSMILDDEQARSTSCKDIGTPTQTIATSFELNGNENPLSQEGQVKDGPNLQKTTTTCIASFEDDDEVPVIKEAKNNSDCISNDGGSSSNSNHEDIDYNFNEDGNNLFELKNREKVNQNEDITVREEVQLTNEKSSGIGDLCNHEPQTSFCFDLPSQESSTTSLDDSDSSSSESKISFTIYMDEDNDRENVMNFGSATVDKPNVDTTLSDMQLSKSNIEFFNQSISTTSNSVDSRNVELVCKTTTDSQQDSSVPPQSPFFSNHNNRKRNALAICDTPSQKSSKSLIVGSMDLTDTPDQLAKLPTINSDCEENLTDTTAAQDVTKTRSTMQPDLSSDLTDTPNVTQNNNERKTKMRKLLHNKRKRGKIKDSLRCQFLDLEAAGSSGDDQSDEESEEGLSQDSFINDTSQLGYTQGQSLSQENDESSHWQINAEQEREESFSTPIFNRRQRRILSQANLPSSEKAIGKMHFIRSVIDHHRQGGDVDDIEREYQAIMQDPTEGQNTTNNSQE